jgi:hypothetical protein
MEVGGKEGARERGGGVRKRDTHIERTPGGSAHRGSLHVRAPLQVSISTTSACQKSAVLSTLYDLTSCQSTNNVLADNCSSAA